KLERAAVAAGQSPSEFVEEKRKLFVKLWKRLGMKVSEYPYPDLEPDSLRFIYTDHPDHVTSVQRLLKLAQKNSPGVIYKGQYQGRYCVSDERYIADGSEPVNCDICGRPAELISEENYFFKLSAFQDRLLELYEKHPEFVQPDYRRNEVKSFVKSGLRDISVSRKRLKWGIPWPDDPEQVFYVWYDALTSYMTGIGYAQGPVPFGTGQGPVPSGTGQSESGNEEFRKYWRNKPGESELVHMIGKDILRFHAVYWPSFIMAAYPDQPEMLPTTVFAHGWIYYEQDKMSKSKGNVVYPEPIVDALDSFGAPGNDALRYYLLREAPFGQDTSFSYEGLIQRYNSDLANGLGNLTSRTVKMLNQFCRCSVPVPDGAARVTAESNSKAIIRNCRAAFDRYDFAAALTTLWTYVALADKLISDEKPWELAKSDSAKDQEKLQGLLYTVAQYLRTFAVALYPVLPATAERLWQQLGQPGHVWQDQSVRQGDAQGPISTIVSGTHVGKPEPIFPRLDKAKTLDKLDELAEADRERDKPTGATPQPQASSPQPPVPYKPKEVFIPVQTENKPEAAPKPAPETRAPSPQPLAPSVISIEDFAKVDMRVGEVKAAEHVPGASKLLKLMVDIGTEVRQLVAGLAEYYQPENLIGMKVVVVTNLQPRKLRGVESNGMIVAATLGEQGRPVLVTFKEDVANGARLR
ncbi:MAG TPA: methionine--tRNA ligase subunit beta, partial [Terriglobia bacterium]|nr:methionine--tRNA ligase subunit beta [Terriglobia bacterium]